MAWDGTINGERVSERWETGGWVGKPFRLWPTFKVIVSFVFLPSEVVMGALLPGNDFSRHSLRVSALGILSIG